MKGPNQIASENLYRLIKQGLFDIVREILSQFWLPTSEAENFIREKLGLLGAESNTKAIVSGETKSLTAYIIDSTGVLVITPFSSINDNLLLREVYSDIHFPPKLTWYIFPPDSKLLCRLTLPRVLLVNPCVLKNFPIPRLCLSIGLLAGYLRKYQKAHVEILDMQVGSTVEDIVLAAVKLKPSLFGLSISYGQKYVALSILEGIYHYKREKVIDPLVVLGNIIPASCPPDFIHKYPDLMIAYSEGELTIIDLVDYLNGQLDLDSVRGIVYADAMGQIQQTSTEPVPVNTIPLPALDTIRDLAKCRGAITLELSRGCQWNACTLCPRHHKSSIWKTYEPNQIIEQFGYLNEVCEKLGLNKHVFLADEEFVGGMKDGLETERIIRMAQGLIRNNFGIKFDAAARVDQVYTANMDRRWHIKRMEMWHLCRQAGLDYLFLGLESGSVAQLERLWKGISPEYSIIAIRILSALGIPLRFGFITFDQLMVGLEDIKKNITFLERTDAFMKPIDVKKYGYGMLFRLLIHDKDFVAEHSAQKPIYAGVSYMLATMEVLINSRYKIMLQNAEGLCGRCLVLDKDVPDTNMGRHLVGFVDELVGDISISCQKWIDRHFSVAYAIKSLSKVALEDEKELLLSWITKYRQICLFLLKALVYIFDNAPTTTNDRIIVHIGEHLIIQQIKELRRNALANKPSSRSEIIEACMNIFDAMVRRENERMKELIQHGQITDARDSQLFRTLNRWEENTGVWNLINSQGKPSAD